MKSASLVLGLLLLCGFLHAQLFYRHKDCDTTWDLMCGVDGLLYENQCSLDNNNVPKQKNGLCPMCSMPFLWSPLCGINGFTYGNKWEAECFNVDIAYAGECDGPPRRPDNSSVLMYRNETSGEITPF